MVGQAILGLFALTVVALILQINYRWDWSPLLRRIGLQEPLDTTYDSAGKKVSELPAVVVTGDDDRSLSFRDWHLDYFDAWLVGTMTWNGHPKIASITYTVRKNGVVIHRGAVEIPGNEFKAGEPTKVTIVCPDGIKGTEVTIEVQY